MQKSVLRKGVMFGIIVGLAWGLDGVLMGKVGESSIFEGIGTSPLITAFLHDGFAAIWLLLIMLCTGKFTSTFKLMKTKVGRVTMLAALVGAPIGMSGYVLGIKYAGASYASSISVIYPGIGAIFAFLLLKEKIPKFSVVGICMTIIGAAMMGIIGATGNVSDTFMLGIGFTLIAVIAWALEGTIIAFAMKGQKENFNEEKATPEQLLTLRYIVSGTVYGVVIMPVIGGYPTVGEVFATNTFIAYAGIATLGVITYLSWYKAVSLVGGGLGTALNSTAAFWTVVYGFLLFRTPVSISQIIWCVVIILGVFIFALAPNFSSKNKEQKNNEESVVKG